MSVSPLSIWQQRRTERVLIWWPCDPGGGWWGGGWVHGYERRRARLQQRRKSSPLCGRETMCALYFIGCYDSSNKYLFHKWSAVVLPWTEKIKLFCFWKSIHSNILLCLIFVCLCTSINSDAWEYTTSIISSVEILRAMAQTSWEAREQTYLCISISITH